MDTLRLAVAKRTSTDATATDAQTEGGRREIRAERRRGDAEELSEHIAHYNPHQSCEILSQPELEAEVLAACGVVVGGARVHAYVCLSTYCRSDTDVGPEALCATQRERESEKPRVMKSFLR